MIQKLENGFLIALLTVCLTISISVSSLFALDVKGLANKEEKVTTVAKEVEYTKKWFFGSVHKNFNAILKEHPDFPNFAGVLESFDFLDITEYDPNYNPWGGGWGPANVKILQKFLVKSYGINENIAIGTNEYDAMQSLFTKFANYYSFKNGLKTYHVTQEKLTEDIKNSINSLFMYFRSSLPETEKNKLINFIDDFDKFLDNYYTEKTAIYIANTQKEKKEQQDRIASIKSGKESNDTYENAKIYYDAQNGFNLIQMPPVKPTMKYYFVSGKLESKDGDLYIVQRVIFGDIKYFVFRLTDSAGEKNFRIGGELQLIGQFVDLYKYTTTIGTKKYAPVFDAVFVEL
ncbi:hypothetical protein DSCW_36010 [Desulfosarcina widdelii]|uniref:Uncharacterized protein n=1 Tax=Desulfosarcina widdelii TaxID=947919 RepID=A0A5K7ZCJ5_9BACT|nr:hypothetical protein [Desulfosarcina widdelii]BBO76184.1 hypothetical protein DSCW_36010 [Desulfosarcina widdelii]